MTSSHLTTNSSVKEKKEPFWKLSVGQWRSMYQDKMITAKGYILGLLRIHGKAGWKWAITPKKMREEFGIPERTFFRSISQLKAEGLINWTTPSQTTYFMWLNTEEKQDTETTDSPCVETELPPMAISTATNGSSHCHTDSPCVEIELPPMAVSTATNGSSHCHQWQSPLPPMAVSMPEPNSQQASQHPTDLSSDLSNSLSDVAHSPTPHPVSKLKKLFDLETAQQQSQSTNHHQQTTNHHVSEQQQQPQKIQLTNHHQAANHHISDYAVQSPITETPQTSLPKIDQNSSLRPKVVTTTTKRTSSWLCSGTDDERNAFLEWQGRKLGAELSVEAQIRGRNWANKHPEDATALFTDWKNQKTRVSSYAKSPKERDMEYHKYPEIWHQAILSRYTDNVQALLFRGVQWTLGWLEFLAAYYPQWSTTISRLTEQVNTYLSCDDNLHGLPQ